MKRSNLFYALALVMITAFTAQAQFILTVKSTPDSAEVFMNGELKGRTPCKVVYNWNQVPDSGLHFLLKLPKYEDQQFVIDEKPRVIRSQKEITLKKIDLRYTLDPESPLVEFDRLLAEFPEGKSIGTLRGSSGQSSLNWAGFSRLGSDDMDLKTYDILGTVGFNTPMKQSSQLFSSEKQQKKRTARFLLGARVTDIWLEITQFSSLGYIKYRSNARISIEWQVFDRSTNQVVLVDHSVGNLVNEMTNAANELVLVSAYGDALYTFLGDGKLYELVRNAGTNSTVEAVPNEDENEAKDAGKPLEIPAIKVESFESLPLMIQQSTQGCVTISTDAGHGSGVLISADGYVLTAAHVVNGINRLDIIFSNGVELEGKVIASDDEYDIALIKVPGAKYKALPIGEGMKLGLGEEVITIGTPGDIELGQSISKGVLSGKRKVEDIIYLQTDVAVSPGNSGGPLLDAKGKIIGIIQRKLIGSGIEGVGFALPIETALKRLGLTVLQD